MCPCVPLLLDNVFQVEPRAVFAAAVNNDMQQRMAEQALQAAPISETMQEEGDYDQEYDDNKSMWMSLIQIREVCGRDIAFATIVCITWSF